jgi:2-oxoglutarate dehydrogenase E1 component
MEQMAEGTSFRAVIGDECDAGKVKRHVVCSGKVYFDIIDHLEKSGLREQVAVTRLEQIAPFPFPEIEAEDLKYKNADLVFVQEEHMNMGPFPYVGPRLATAVKGHREGYQTKYIGRSPAAAAATGSSKVHAAELSNFLGEITEGL